MTTALTAEIVEETQTEEEIDQVEIDQEGTAEVDEVTATVEVEEEHQVREEHQENLEEMKRREEDHVTEIDRIEEIMKIDFQKTQSKLKKFSMSSLPIFRKNKGLM